jgi:ribosomal protein L14E/L6E/L27E
MERLTNIVTKLTEDERTQKKVNTMLIADVWKDFPKAEDENVVKQANKLKGKIMGIMQKESIRLFEEYMSK